jgi:hypothetical protein
MHRLQPFAAINRSPTRRPLLESEPFGHERGAFSAVAQIGRFQLARPGHRCVSMKSACRLSGNRSSHASSRMINSQSAIAFPGVVSHLDVVSGSLLGAPLSD